MRQKHASTKYKEEYSLNLGTETTDRGESESETANNIFNNKFELLNSDSASDNDGDCSSILSRNEYKELRKAVDRCKADK